MLNPTTKAISEYHPVSDSQPKQGQCWGRCWRCLERTQSVAAVIAIATAVPGTIAAICVSNAVSETAGYYTFAAFWGTAASCALLNAGLACVRLVGQRCFG